MCDREGLRKTDTSMIDEICRNGNNLEKKRIIVIFCLYIWMETGCAKITQDHVETNVAPNLHDAALVGLLQMSYEEK